MSSQAINRGSSRYNDPEAQYTSASEADDVKLDRQIRHGFIRKVYGIICAQLTLTFGIGLFFALFEPARVWMITSTAAVVLLVVLAITSLAILIALACSRSLATTYPTNYVLLSLFTLCISFSVGGSCASAASSGGIRVVLMALGATAVIVAGLTLFAFQTKYDFTSFLGIALVLGLGLMIFGFIRIFLPYSKPVEIVYATIGALVMAFYIIIDTQLLIGSGKIQLDEEQYVLASISLYLDIVNFFTYMLRLFSAISRD